MDGEPAVRAWMAERVRLIPMQARSASERNPRGSPVTAACIPLLALRDGVGNLQIPNAISFKRARR